MFNEKITILKKIEDKKQKAKRTHMYVKCSYLLHRKDLSQLFSNFPMESSNFPISPSLSV